MYDRKPQTILTSRNLNKKVKASRVITVKEPELTSPAENHYGKMYVNIAGVTMPIKK